MSFNINSQSYSSYLGGTNNKTFSKEKIAEMEKASSDSAGKNKIKNSAITTINKNGKAYYLVPMDGQYYLYDYENNSYTRYEKNAETNNSTAVTYNVDTDSLSIADNETKERQNYKYDKDSANPFSFVTTTRDNNIYSDTIGVIDNFTVAENPNHGLSHGTLVSALASSNGANVNNYNIGYDSDGNLDLAKATEHINKIIEDVKAGKDIDSVNLSISVDLLPSWFGFENGKEVSADTLRQIENAINKNGPESYFTSDSANIVKNALDLVNSIKTLSNEGVAVYISSCNAANDIFSDETDVSGRDAGSFNLLTLAGQTENKNVHVIGSKNINGNENYYASSKNGVKFSEATLEDSTAYSNYNELVDALYTGTAQFNFVKQSNSKLYFDVDGDGKADCVIDAKDLNLNSEQVNNLKLGFSINGTSFASPFAAANKNSSLS